MVKITAFPATGARAAVALGVCYCFPLSLVWAQTEPPPARQQAVFIRGVSVTGTRGVRADEAARAANRVAFGRPGSEATIRDAAQAVIALYRKRGFSVAQVIGSELTGDGVLRLTVAEGTIRRVIVRGATRTRASVIRSALSLRPGDSYREDLARADRGRLARLGIFEDVRIAPVGDALADEAEAEERERAERAAAAQSGGPDAPSPPPASDDTGKPTVIAALPASEDAVGFVDVVVRVKETQTANVAAAVGSGSAGSGLVGFVDVSEDNYEGRALRLSAQWQRTDQRRIIDNGDVVNEGARMAFSVGAEQPLLGPGTTGFTARVYNNNTIFLPFFSNNQDTLRTFEIRRGARFSAGRNLPRQTAIYVTARRDEVGYDRVPERLNPPLALLADADAVVAALGFNLISDGRDAVDNPHTGFFRTITYERSLPTLGGNHLFAQLRGDFRQYVPLSASPNSPVLAARFLAGASGGTVPLSEQFWIGGYELLRGYDLYSIHGDRLLLGSLEGRVPLAPGIQGVLFTDVGNAWEAGQNRGVRSLKTGVGVGLRFLSPIGPIRLDVAYGDRLRTYISLGQSY